MQAVEALRNPSEADDVSLDMQRYYDKHQISSLAPYGEIAPKPGWPCQTS